MLRKINSNSTKVTGKPGSVVQLLLEVKCPA